MKKLMSGALLLLASVAAVAQTWKLSEVPGKDKSVAGYIYHTNATGTRIGTTTDKAFSSLRIVCSTKSNAPPMLVLYWNGMTGDGNQYPSITADGKQVQLSQDVWIQEGNILYRAIYKDDQLMKSIKSSTRIRVTWNDGPTKYVTGFEVKDIESGLGDFNAVCKTQI